MESIQMINVKKLQNYFNKNVSTKIRKKWYKCNLIDTITEETLPQKHSTDILPKTMIIDSNKTDVSEMISDVSETDSDYIFMCKNVSPNLQHIVGKNEFGVLTFGCSSVKPIHELFDIHERIIPEYYINNNGIKSGGLNFNYYATIIDSIRNMRTLSVYQKVYIENCTKEEYMEIIKEYNKVIEMLSHLDL